MRALLPLLRHRTPPQALTGLGADGPAAALARRAGRRWSPVGAALVVAAGVLVPGSVMAVPLIVEAPVPVASGAIAASGPTAVPAGPGPAARARAAADMGRGPIGPRSAEARVRALQQRLTWAGIRAPRTGVYDPATAAAVRLWQSKRVLPATGHVDGRTLASLAAATTEDGAISPRCRRPGVVVCVDTTQKVLRYYRGGVLVRQFDVNVGPERGQKEFGRYSSTRVGAFTVKEKQRFAVSSQYGTPMHWFMPFDGGIAFHHSAYFAATGYANSSYGCVTIASPRDAAWLFAHVQVGTRVVVHA